MLLRDLFGDGARGSGTVAGRGDAARLRRRAPCSPGALFFCVPGFTARRARLRARRDRARRRRARRRAAARARRAGGARRRRARARWRPSPRASTATRRARLRGRRHHRHERQDDDRVPRRARCSRRRAARRGLLGTVEQVVGGVERAGGAHDARGDRPAGARSRAMVDGGDAACVDGGLLARARAAARRRDPLGRRGLHEPHAGPPRLPPDDGGLLRGQAAAVRGRARRRAWSNVDDAYGRRLADGVPRTRSPSASTATTPTLRADGPARPACAGSRFDADGPRSWHAPLPGRFNVAERARARSPRRARSASTTTRSRRRCRPPRACPGRFEPVDEGQDFAVLVDYAHTPDSLENVLRAARELARGPRASCVFGCGGDRDRGKRPLMGADRRARWPTSRSSPPTTRARRTPSAIIAEILAGVAGGRAGRVEAIEDRREAIERAVGAAPGRATSS